MKERKPQSRSLFKRETPKKKFHVFSGSKTKKKYHSTINDRDDEVPNKTFIRILVGIVLVHIIVIGGVFLRNFLAKQDNPIPIQPPIQSQGTSEGSSTPSTNQSQPPATSQDKSDGTLIVEAPTNEPSQTIVQTSTTTPEDSTSTAVRNNSSDILPAIPINDSDMSSDTSSSNDIPVALPLPDETNSAPIHTQSAVKPGKGRHIIATGDTWDSIAQDNNCTVEQLKMLNPNSILSAGTQLVLPQRPEEIIKETPSETTVSVKKQDSVHVLKRGETLSKLSRQYGIPVDEIQKHNNIKDPRKIQVGQKIRIPQK